MGGVKGEVTKQNKGRVKILYVTTVSITLNTFFVPHIKFLIDQGYHVDIASNIDKDICKEYVEMGVKHIKIRFSRNPLSMDNIIAYKEIRELQIKERYDIIHVHTPVAAFVTRMALRKFDVKMIYTSHGFHFYKGAPLVKKKIFYLIEKCAAKYTDVLVTINKEDYESAKSFKLKDNGNVKLIHGVGIEANDFKNIAGMREKTREVFNINEEDFLILILAEINKNKNQIQIIKAMELLKNKGYSIKVLCAGNGSLKERMEKEVLKRGLEDNIKFIGFRSDVKELLDSSDCVALFSKREGLGKCLLEAMVMDKLLIATNTRGPRELIEHNKNGFLVEVDDYRSTAEYIEKLYLDKNLQQKFMIESRDKIKKYYLIQVLKELKELYE